jgi:hypothetical protein
MLPRKELILLFLLMAFLFPVLAIALPVNAIGSDSLKKGTSQDETILFNMINDMRIQNKLPVIPYSFNLSKVAHIHIDDLIKWRPQDQGCSLHSWSGSGKWSPCCNTKDPSGIQCMKAKPGEITAYTGNGYELIYWGEEKASPVDAIALWQQVSASSDMILGRGKWKGYQWKALGVGIKEGYAILWFGDKIDNAPYDASVQSLAVAEKPVTEKPVVKPAIVYKSAVKEKTPVKTESVAKQEPVVKQEPAVKPKATVVLPETSKEPLTVSGTTYYLIASSLKTSEAANTELKNIKAKGYPGAMIIESGVLFRIALASYTNEQDARAKLSELKTTFPGIWLFKK